MQRAFVCLVWQQTVQIYQPVPAAILGDGKHRRREGADRLFVALGHLLENAVEIGGDKSQRTFTIARQLQQCGVRVGCPLATQVGLQCLCQCLTHCQSLSLPGQTPLQQIQRGVELAARIGILFDGVRRGAEKAIDCVHQTLETG